MLIDLRQNKNADMQFVSNLMISLSKRLKELGKKVRDTMQEVSEMNSEATAIFD